MAERPNGGIVGNNRRQDRLRERRNRETTPTAARTPAPARTTRPSPKPQWRQTLDSWGGLPVAGALIAGVVVLAVMVWASRPGASAGGDAYVPVERAQTNGRVVGAPDAPIKIIAFLDYQCPHCKTFHDTTEAQVEAEFVDTGIAALEMRYYAFLGPDSVRAAEGAECAADQNMFWPYQDVLFLRQGQQNSGVYSVANLKRYAREVAAEHSEFDVSAFERCVDSGEKRAVVDEMTRQAEQLGIRSTPSFLVNGQLLQGAQPIEGFRTAIAQIQAQ
jgi:protein-disulfide isomerase